MGQFENWQLFGVFTFGIGITGSFMVQTLITCLGLQYAVYYNHICSVT